MMCHYFLSAAFPCQQGVCTPATSPSCADSGISPRPAQLQRQESVNPGGNWSVKRCNELRQNRAIDTGTNVRWQQAVNSSPSSAPSRATEDKASFAAAALGSQSPCTNPNPARLLLTCRRQRLPGSPQHRSGLFRAFPWGIALLSVFCWKGTSHLSCLPVSCKSTNGKKTLVPIIYTSGVVFSFEKMSKMSIKQKLLTCFTEIPHKKPQRCLAASSE